MSSDRFGKGYLPLFEFSLSQFHYKLMSFSLGLTVLLEVAGSIPEHKTLKTTTNTRMHASLVMQKVFDNLSNFELFSFLGLTVLLEVAGSIPEHKTLKTTNNTCMHASLVIQKVFDDLSDFELFSFLGLTVLLEVAGSIPEHKTLKTTNNTRMHASLVMQKVFDDLVSDKERDRYRAAANAYFT